MNFGDSPPPGGEKRVRKRQWRTADFSQFMEPIQKATQSKFVIIERTNGDKDFGILNKILMGKYLDSIFPSGHSRSRQIQGGNVLFNIYKESEAKRAVAMGEHCIDRTLDIMIKISFHTSMNTSKGTFYARGLLKNETLEEILEVLEPQKVTKFEQMKSFKNGKLEPTDRFIVTFDSNVLPKHIKIGYMEYEIQTFYDNPLRCTNCQKYGHTKKYCTQESVCRICARTEPHEPNDCGPAKCVNCCPPLPDDHPSNDPKCETRVKEQFIKRLQVDNRISATQARRQFESMSQNPRFNSTFAEIVMNKEERLRRISPNDSDIADKDKQIEVLTNQLKELQTERQELRKLVENLQVQNSLLMEKMDIFLTREREDREMRKLIEHDLSMSEFSSSNENLSKHAETVLEIPEAQEDASDVPSVEMKEMNATSEMLIKSTKKYSETTVDPTENGKAKRQRTSDHYERQKFDASNQAGATAMKNKLCKIDKNNKKKVLDKTSLKKFNKLQEVFGNDYTCLYNSDTASLEFSQGAPTSSSGDSDKFRDLNT